jgi:phosphatidylinositol transfer protein SFH5
MADTTNMAASKPEETKVEEAKVEEAKVEEAKVEETKAEETKVDATPAPIAAAAAEDNKDAAPTAASETPSHADAAVPAQAPPEPEPSSNATAATDEKATAAEAPKEEVGGTTGSATPAPVPAPTEAKAAEAKPAEPAEGDEKEPTKGDAETETETKAAAKEAATAKETAPKKSAFEEFDAKVADILKEVDHDEMWGVKLVTPASSHVPTQIVIQKFLNANDGDLAKSIDQFKAALKFRKEKKPLELIKKTFSATKFADLGAVTVYPVKDSSVPEVFTWNLYGNVKGKINEVFTPLDE